MELPPCACAVGLCSSKCLQGGDELGFSYIKEGKQCALADQEKQKGFLHLFWSFLR